MPVSSRVRAQVQELLPGERLDYVFPAVIPRGLTGNVVVAVTATSVVVLSTGFLGRELPRGVLARYRRPARIGEPDLHGIPSFLLDGVRYEVDDEYLAVVSALHLEAAGGDPLPPDPLPDL